MAERNKPWTIHRLDSMIVSPGHLGTIDENGVCVVPVPEPYYAETLRERLEAAWWVFTRRAYAVEWPKAGDLERALGTYRVPKRPPPPAQEPSHDC